MATKICAFSLLCIGIVRPGRALLLAEGKGARMVGVARLDVYLESFDGASPEHREGANSLKVGDKLRLQEALADEQPEGGDSTPEGLLLVVTGEGGHVGHVKQSLLQGKTFMTLCATVRSIKRDKETSDVMQVNCMLHDEHQCSPKNYGEIVPKLFLTVLHSQRSGPGPNNRGSPAPPAATAPR